MQYFFHWPLCSSGKLESFVERTEVVCFFIGLSKSLAQTTDKCFKQNFFCRDASAHSCLFVMADIAAWVIVLDKLCRCSCSLGFFRSCIGTFTRALQQSCNHRFY